MNVADIDLTEEARLFFNWIVDILNRIQSYSVVLIILISLILYVLFKYHKIQKKYFQWFLRFGVGVMLSESGMIQLGLSLAAQGTAHYIEPFMPLIGYLILLWIKREI